MLEILNKSWMVITYENKSTLICIIANEKVVDEDVKIIYLHPAMLNLLKNNIKKDEKDISSSIEIHLYDFFEKM